MLIECEFDRSPNVMRAQNLIWNTTSKYSFKFIFVYRILVQQNRILIKKCYIGIWTHLQEYFLNLARFYPNQDWISIESAWNSHCTNIERTTRSYLCKRKYSRSISSEWRNYRNNYEFHFENVAEYFAFEKLYSR